MNSQHQVRLLIAAAVLLFLFLDLEEVQDDGQGLLDENGQKIYFE